MGHSRPIDDVRAMSASLPTPEVSLHRGERRSGPKGCRLALSERLGSDEDPDWGNIVRVPSGSAHSRRSRYFLGVVCREMLVPSRCRKIPMAQPEHNRICRAFDIFVGPLACGYRYTCYDPGSANRCPIPCSPPRLRKYSGHRLRKSVRIRA